MQKIDLQLDTENELIFKVTVEGTSPASPRCRLVVDAGNISHMFSGDIDRSGEVTVLIPSLERVLKEGTYDANLEVIVDDRVFVPLSININFEKSMRVTAETVTRKRRSDVVARAELITGVKTRKEPVRPIRVKSDASVDETPEISVESKPARKVSPLNNMDIKNLSESQIRDLIKKVFLK